MNKVDVTKVQVMKTVACVSDIYELKEDHRYIMVINRPLPMETIKNMTEHLDKSGVNNILIVCGSGFELYEIEK